MRITRRTLTAAALAATIAIGSAGCANMLRAIAAPISPKPAAESVQTTRDFAIKIATATTIAIGLGEDAVKFADRQEQAGRLSIPATRGIVQANIAFATAARAGLIKLGKVSTRPDLVATTLEILSSVSPFLTALDSGNDSTFTLGKGIRIAIAVLREFVSSAGGDPLPASFGFEEVQ